MLHGVTTISNDTIGWILDLAYDDQEQYLKFGDPQLDYGDDWPEVARQRAAWCKEISDAATIHGESERWAQLAAEYLQYVD